AEMKAGNLDVVIGGLPADAPWTSDIALTRPYTKTTGPDGMTIEIVLGVTPGGDELLVVLEQLLAEQGGKVRTARKDGPGARTADPATTRSGRRSSRRCVERSGSSGSR